MKVPARVFVAPAAALLLSALASAPAAGADLAGIGGGDGGEVVLALHSSAVLGLSGPPAPLRIAALPGRGLLLHEHGKAGSFAAPDPLAVSLTAREGKGGTTLVAALEGGGVVDLDLADLDPSLRSTLHVVSLASGDLDGDGRDDLLAAVDGGSAFLLPAGGEPRDLASSGRVLRVAAGRFLGLDRDQAALALEGGAIQVLDLSSGKSVLLDSPPVKDMAAADLDGDGKDELLVLDAQGQLYAADPRAGVVSWIDVFHADSHLEEVFLVLGLEGAGGPPTFLRGDANDDGRVDLSDAVAILGDLFLGEDARASCRDALDVNDDGKADIADPIFTVSFLFLRGEAIPPPYPRPGPDPTPDALPCP